MRTLYRAADNLARAERIRHLVAAATKAATEEGHPIDPGTAFGIGWPGHYSKQTGLIR
ncbi:MAG: hypothetical protein IPP47_32980 [Bryobacterales bacterium]|nr:hypothetical protein [Bryobacterales bacterium]